jgi:hypothetical protein
VNPEKFMSRAPKLKPQPIHHWLVAGKVLFAVGDKNEVGNFEHNTIVTNDKKFVTAHMIGRAQQMLQMHLHEQIQDATMKIVNVHINSINYLGAMTREQFYTPPLADETATQGQTETAPGAPIAPVTKDDPFLTPPL